MQNILLNYLKVIIHLFFFCLFSFLTYKIIILHMEIQVECQKQPENFLAPLINVERKL